MGIVEVSSLIAAISCLVGVLSWTNGRDKRLTADAKWRGSVDAKLNLIIGLRTDVDGMNREIHNHSERIAKVEASSAQAHHRIDELIKK